MTTNQEHTQKPKPDKSQAFPLEKELKMLLEASESSFLSSSSSSFQLNCFAKNSMIKCQSKSKFRKRSVKKASKNDLAKKKRGRPSKFEILERFKSPVEMRKKSDNKGEYTFTPVLSSQRKVPIN